MSDPAPKPGVKSTEFWLTIITTVFGLALLAYGVVSGNDTALVVGGGIAGIPIAGYSIGRGNAKGAVLLLSASMLLSMSGCAVFLPSERFETRKAELATEVADGMNAVAIAAHTVRVLHAQNVLNDESTIEIREHLIIAAASLGRAANAIDASNLESAESERNIFNQALMHAELLIQTHTAKPKEQPSNGPSHNLRTGAGGRSAGGEGGNYGLRTHQAVAFRIADYRGRRDGSDETSAGRYAIGFGRTGRGTRLAA